MNFVTAIHQVTNVLVNPKTALFNIFNPARQYLRELEIRNATFAHIICRIIPSQCPFERNFCLFGQIYVQIPPLCKLNPVYEEVVGLRFRALCYLADECNENVHCYL